MVRGYILLSMKYKLSELVHVIHVGKKKVNKEHKEDVKLFKISQFC